MSAHEKRYRRNFLIAIGLHVGILGGILGVEKLPGFGPRAEAPPAFVEAALLGELPEGTGSGLGAYKAPEPAVSKTQLAAPPGSASDEIAAPVAKRATAAKPDPGDIPVASKKTAAPKPVAKPTTTKKPSATIAATATRSTGTGTSASEFKKRFASALASSADGTAGGDNKTAGGGKARGARIGSPDGSPDGVGGGVGQGTPNWQYFRQVHDVLYQAWEQPDSAVDKKLMTTVALRVARDGSIADATVRLGSGNKSMDESVLSAVRRVPRLEPPPAALVRGEFALITVNFQAEG